MRIFLLFSSIVFLLATSASAQERTWTDVDGNTMEAELVRVLRTEAVFLIDGEQKSIPLKYFSLEDRQYLNRIAKGEEELPGKGTDEPEYTPSYQPGTRPDPKPKAPAERPKPEERRWSMRSGEFLQGKPLALTIEDLVVLQFPDGKTTTLGLDSFSVRDQDLIISYFRDPKPEPETKPPVVEFGSGSLKTLPGENNVVPTEVIEAPPIESINQGTEVASNGNQTPTTNETPNANSSSTTRRKPSGRVGYRSNRTRTPSNNQIEAGGNVAPANAQTVNPNAGSGSGQKWAIMFGGLLVIVLGFVAAKKVVLGDPGSSDFDIDPEDED